MANNPLVSVIIPCWNAEKCIFRLLDSLLNQTYQNLEIFVIDDGSSDNSAQLVKSYISKFEARHNTLTYIWQEHAGQSYAINKGLKLFSGKYIVWPDSDDFYSSNEAIEKMVQTLENASNDVSMVRTFSLKLDESSLEQVGINKVSSFKQDLFYDCLFAKNGFYFTPGQYMARSEVFLERIPNRHIFEEAYSGQNWQMMLPVLYKKKCITLPEILYFVLVRRNSDSRWAYKHFDAAVQQSEVRRQGIIYTLNQIEAIPSDEKKKLITQINEKYDFIFIKSCIRLNKKNELRSFLKKQKGIPNKFIFALTFCPFFFKMANVLFSRGK